MIDELQFITNQSTGIHTMVSVPVSLYPNPVRDQLHIESPADFRWMRVTDITGKVHIQQAYRNTLSLEALPQGSYYLTLYSDKVYTVQPFFRY